MNMRRNLTIASAVLAMVAIPLVAQSKAKTGGPGATASSGHGIKCMAGAEKSACTAADVQDINRMVVTGRRMHKPIAMIGSVQLGGPDGTLTCSQTSGAPCTDEQTAALRDYVAGQSGSASRPFFIVREVDKSSPL